MILEVAATFVGSFVVLGLVGSGGVRAVRSLGRRRRLAPCFVVVPAPDRCAVRDVRVIAAAWRARGLVVVERRRRLEVRTVDGARAEIPLPPSRRLGDVPFVMRSDAPELVHALALIASAELGPLVCAIDGCVHGFDAGAPGAYAAMPGTIVLGTARPTTSRATVRLPA